MGRPEAGCRRADHKAEPDWPRFFNVQTVQGADELVGRGGADRFDYYYTDNSTPTDPDRILDFSRAQSDKIDLSGIDARRMISMAAMAGAA